MCLHCWADVAADRMDSSASGMSGYTGFSGETGITGASGVSAVSAECLLSFEEFGESTQVSGLRMQGSLQACCQHRVKLKVVKAAFLSGLRIYGAGLCPGMS